MTTKITCDSEPRTLRDVELDSVVGGSLSLNFTKITYAVAAQKPTTESLKYAFQDVMVES